MSSLLPVICNFYVKLFFFVGLVCSSFVQTHFCNSAIFLAHLAYHCRSWQRRCGKSCHWTGWAYCRPRSAGPGWWRWRGQGESWSTYETDRCEAESPSTYSSADARHYSREQREGSTHKSSMLGSVNCTNKSLSWSTPEKETWCWRRKWYFFLHLQDVKSECICDSTRLTEGDWIWPEPRCGHDDLIQRLFVCQHLVDLSEKDRRSHLLRRNRLCSSEHLVKIIKGLSQFTELLEGITSVFQK